MQRNFVASYNRAFFAEHIDGSARSARITAPLVTKLVRDVRSVVDVGCGTGVWLASFKRAGVPRVLGLDGGAAAAEGQLEIESDEFRAANLEEDIDLRESFDLCLCLEVAQHLADRAAPVLVRNICKLSDVVLFSAALPGQGGSHLNERWPSYWADLFASAGYEVLDSIRGRIWNDARVEWCYRQNLLLFANKAGLSRMVVSSAPTVASMPLDIIHPACFEQYYRLSGWDGALSRVETLSQTVSLLEQRNADLERALQAIMTSTEVSQLEQRNTDLERALQAIMTSTSWKLTWPLRRLLGKHVGLRRRLRVLARIAWSIVSGKFLRRLRRGKPL